MPRKQRTAIKGIDPKYHSDLPRKAEHADAAPVEPKPTPQKPKPIAADAPQQRPTTTKKPKRTPKPKPVPTPARTEPKTAAQPTSNETREVHLTAAITRAHGQQIDALVEKSIDRKVPIRLAGRKAVQLFEPKREYIEKPEADRLPIRDGYQTTKRVNVDLIDHLRAEQDPYGLSSDTAMLRGQFEPLFWECLDEVIKELSSK